MEEIKIKIPIKPLSVNEAWQGRRFKTPECKQFCKDMAKILPYKSRIFGKIEVHYRFFLVNHALTDYDNLIKTMQDNLVKRGYFEDDRKIYRAIIEKIPSKEDFIEISIKQLEEVPV